MLWNDWVTPNMKNSGSPSRQYTKDGHSSGSRGRASVRILHSLHTLLLLAMITCFMSNQICRAGGFFFDSYALVLYRTLLLINTTPLCGYEATRVLNLRAFIIRLIPGSLSPPPPSACQLESLGTRLSPHPTYYTLSRKIIYRYCNVI